jgi:hypothetical protein
VPEEDIETGEIKEHLDHAIEEGERGPGWMQYLSVSTAVLAVLAAVASLESGAYSNDAILAKNDGILQQANRMQGQRGRSSRGGASRTPSSIRAGGDVFADLDRP